MRQAPPLALSCPPSRAWRGLCLALGAVAGLALAGWSVGHLEPPPALAALALLAGAAGGLGYGWLAAGPARPVQVAWDGRGWLLDGEPGGLHVKLDLDRWLLLRWTASDARARPRRRWITLSGGTPGGDLPALRAALYSRPPEATPPELPHVRAPDRDDH